MNYQQISEDERLSHQSIVWRLIRKYVWKLEHSRTDFKSQEEMNGWFSAFHALERLCNMNPSLGTKTPPRKVGKNIKNCYTIMGTTTGRISCQDS